MKANNTALKAFYIARQIHFALIALSLLLAAHGVIDICITLSIIVYSICFMILLFTQKITEEHRTSLDIHYDTTVRPQNTIEKTGNYRFANQNLVVSLMLGIIITYGFELIGARAIFWHILGGIIAYTAAYACSLEIIRLRAKFTKLFKSL